MLTLLLVQEKFEDTKGVIISLKSKKDKQYNEQKNNDKRTNNDLQNITQKTKDRAIRIPLTTVGVPGCSGKVSSTCST